MSATKLLSDQIKGKRLMFNDEDRILVVAAHPDDEVLAMGGLLSLAKKNKLPVSVLFLGEGVSARFAKTIF